MRLIIAEDSKLLRNRMVRDLSEIEGIEVVFETETQAEAVQITRKLKPDLVILDIRLKDGSGIDALREIKSHLPTTAVIMLTNSATLQHREHCREVGAEFFFDKTREYDELFACMKLLARANSKSGTQGGESK